MFAKGYIIVVCKIKSSILFFLLFAQQKIWVRENVKMSKQILFSKNCSLY